MIKGDWKNRIIHTRYKENLRMENTKWRIKKRRKVE